MNKNYKMSDSNKGVNSLPGISQSLSQGDGICRRLLTYLWLLGQLSKPNRYESWRTW